jgi:Ca2+-binding RTX toxin-like protein
MTMNNDLMLAVLSMDTYNPQGTIGLASQLLVQPSLSSGFAAVAYSYNGQTVISYRGTDGDYLHYLDAWYGWGGGFGAESTQAGQAAAFYRSVASATFPYSTNVVFTGHSLGGGLAGLMAGLYGKQAVVFDNMAYSGAINQTYFDATHPTIQTPHGPIENTSYQSVLDSFYGTAAPIAPNAGSVSGYQENGQILQLLGQSTGTVVGANVDWGTYSFNPIALHSMSLLVLNMYADQNVTNTAWKGIANVFGPLFLAQNGGTDIAYSVVSEGARPKGDAAAKLLFNDANDLAPLFADASKSLVATGYLDSKLLLKDLATLMVAYDESLTKPNLHLADLKSQDGLFVSTAGKFVAVSLETSSTALHDVSDTSSLDDVRLLIQDLAKTQSGGSLDANAQAILDSAKFVVFAETKTVDAADAASAFTEGYQISGATDAGAIVLGLDGDSHLTGTKNGDVLIGGDGNDVLNGGDGKDLLIGGDGNDVLIGGKGIDVLKGGAGSDIIITGTLDNTPGSGGSTSEKVDGGAGDDYIVLSGSASGLIEVDSISKTDHLMLMPYMVGDTAGADGSLHLTALVGGVAALLKMEYWNRSLDAILSEEAAENDYIDDNDVHYKMYEYFGGPSVAPGLYTSGSNNKANFAFVPPGKEPTFQIEYKLYETKSLLKIDVFSTNSDGTQQDYKIEINNFHEGDYGIYFHDYTIGTYRQVVDASWLGSVVANTSEISAIAATVKAEQEAADIYSLGSDQSIQPSNQRTGLNSFLGSPVTPTLSVDNLIMQLNGTDSDNVLTGTDLSEKIQGNAGNDILIGAGGDDRMNGGTGADRLDGGTGIDTATYATSAAGVSVKLNLVTAQVSAGDASGDILINIENLTGSAFSDTLYGDANANTLLGGAGDDYLYGRTGNDVIDGGTGNDWIEGGAGADTLSGGLGVDAVSYLNATAGVTVNLSLATAQVSGSEASGDILSGFENLYGSAFVDVLTGDAGDNYINAGAGADTLGGGAGNDILVGAAGADIVSGGLGTDTASYYNATAGVTVNLTLATAQVSGGDASGDVLSGIESLRGSAFNDTLTGDAGTNVIEGGAGADTLTGGAGNDTAVYYNSAAGVTVNLSLATAQVSGGEASGDILSGFENLSGSAFNDFLTGDAGSNILSGGIGNDMLTGGAGNDWMIGGGGADRFIFATGFGKDTITDFTVGAGLTHDTLQFNLGTAFDTYAELMAAATQVGVNTVITISAVDTITLQNVAKATLVVDDFSFI